MIPTQTEGTEAIQITLRRIRTALIHWDGDGGTEDSEVHCSAGGATYPGDGATLEALLGRADQRLYSEKGDDPETIARNRREYRLTQDRASTRTGQSIDYAYAGPSAPQ